MTVARDIMTPDATCIGENDSIKTAAGKLKELDVGSMPICGEDDRLKGMLTDRDITIEVVAAGKDPEATTAGDLAKGKPVTIGADDSVEEALRAMADNQVRRLPVIDEQKLVGIVSQADIATKLGDDQTGSLVESISKD